MSDDTKLIDDALASREVMASVAGGDYLPVLNAGVLKRALASVVAAGIASVIGSSLITQVITNGVTSTAPSEDAVFDALASKVNTTTLAGYYTSTQTDTALALKANLASPTLSGTPLTPTAAPGTNTTQIASTAYVVAGIAALSATYQPLDSDLTAIAALTTATFGRSVLAETSATTLKSTLSLGNVDNTSDATKNAASVTLTNKTITSAVMSGTFTGAPTFSGITTFSAFLQITGQITSNATGIQLGYESGSAYFGSWGPDSSTRGKFFFYHASSTGASGQVAGEISTAGLWKFNLYGAGALTTDASGNITATSDATLKHIVREFNAGLRELRLMDRPVVYSWREESGCETEGEYAGWTAQGVQKGLPEAVGQMSDGKLTLSDRPILAATVTAVLSLEDQLITLKQRVEELENA